MCKVKESLTTFLTKLINQLGFTWHALKILGKMITHKMLPEK